MPLSAHPNSLDVGETGAKRRDKRALNRKGDTMHRVQFLRSVPLAAAAGLSSGCLAQAADNFHHGEPRMKRFDD